MPELTWAPEAIADVNDIFDFIAKDSVYYAEKTVSSIITRAGLLIHHPLKGKRVRETEQDYYREIFEGRYRIIYSTFHLPDIEILRVFHTARLLKI